MKYVDFEDVELFHDKIIERTGGSHGIRNKGLIESALNKPFQTFDGKDLYKSDLEKIASLTYSLIRNHGFIDGNKRIGVAIMLLLLKLNEIEIEYTQRELIDLGLGVADGSLDESYINKWLNSKKVKKA